MSAQSTNYPAAIQPPATTRSSPDSPPPPDGGYGWVCVAACFSINCFTWGVVGSYGVYLAHYLSENVFPDATSMDFAFIGSFNLSMAMLVAPLATIIARKYGTQVAMLIGVALSALGYVSASYSYRIWHLYLSEGALVGFGIGFTYIPSIAIIPQWFQEKRSLANGISAAGSGIGGLLFSFMAEAIIKNVSLAWSFRVTAILSCTMNLIATLLIRNRNEAIHPPQRGFDTKLLRRSNVQLLLAWSFISMLGYVVLLFSLPDFARSINLSDSQAATTSAVLNLGTAVGRPFIGIISDHYGRIETAGIMTLACGLTCFAIWLPTTAYGVLILFAFINGAILGVFWATIGPLCAEVAGLAEVPSVLSLCWMSIILPTAFSEVIALKIRRPDSARPYLYPQIFAGSTYICASACLYQLHRIKRRAKSTPS